MKRLKIRAMLIATLMITAYSCADSVKKQEINPLWGMWVQNFPQTSTKNEIMFNDDSTGFVFNVDTLVYETQWKGENEIEIQYKSNNNATLNGYTIKYKAEVVEDTLTLQEEISGKLTRYIRIRQ